MNSKRQKEVERLSNKLIELKYSESTHDSYVSEFRQFVEFLPDSRVKRATTNDIESYLRQIGSKSKHHLALNSIKFFFRQIDCRPKVVAKLGGPRPSKKLPFIHSVQEIQSILDHTRNTKHRAILATIYGSGLRISELQNLEPRDIRSDVMKIHVRSGKGDKDRYTTLSRYALNWLRAYYMIHRPKKYLFEGPNGNKYSQSSIRNILSASKRIAGVIGGTVHTLRHSFATHLIDSGVPTAVIQELLGHESIETTEIYTKCSNKNVVSPLDINQNLTFQ